MAVTKILIAEQNNLRVHSGLTEGQIIDKNAARQFNRERNKGKNASADNEQIETNFDTIGKSVLFSLQNN